MSPVGPAPTMRTSVSTLDLVQQPSRHAAAQIEADSCADHAQQERREQALSIADPPAERASDVGPHPCEQSVHPASVRWWRRARSEEELPGQPGLTLVPMPVPALETR